jgi:ATP-dependent Clp protease protease subunit
VCFSKGTLRAYISRPRGRKEEAWLPLRKSRPEVYGIFSGPIDQAGTQRLANGLTTSSANNVKSVHLMFQSQGGGIGEGICLHNLFQSLPFDLTLYNGGSVASIAVIAYLGAKRRKVSAYASFMIHRTQTTTTAANTQTVKTFAESAVFVRQEHRGHSAEASQYASRKVGALQPQ